MNCLILIILFLLTIFLTWYMLTKPVYNTEYKKMVQILGRQVARWSVASNQDENPIIRALHGNYGAAYLFALGDISNPEDISNILNVDYKTFRKHVLDIQDTANKTLVLNCPNIAPKDKFLAVVGGEA